MFPEDESADEGRLLDETPRSQARLRRANAVPDVRFDQLLGALLALVPKYRFVLPPYFLNNARALGTLPGWLGADPNFNILRVVYPFMGKYFERPHGVARASQSAARARARQEEPGGGGA